jgi:hypothetical protein
MLQKVCQLALSSRKSRRDDRRLPQNVGTYGIVPPFCGMAVGEKGFWIKSLALVNK